MANYHETLPFLLLLLTFFQVENCQVQCSSDGECNLYEGSWEIDQSPPPYNTMTCPFIPSSFDCQKNGRPDVEYLKYKWQPSGCNLQRFDGLEFLEKFRGKHIMFVGDSIGVDQSSSLTCLLYNAKPNLKYSTTFKKIGDIAISTFTILEYDLKVTMDLNHFFVDIIPTPKGRILNLDSIQDGTNWLGVDMLIFNTWHWWNYRKPGQPWDYVQDGEKISEDIDRVYALERGLGTWAKWIDNNIDPKKTRIFFQGVSPDHYNGADWGQPHKNCGGQERPIIGSKYPGIYPTGPVNVTKSTLAKMKTPVTLLDTTYLSLFRIDGHPSHYDGLHHQKGVDCTHWCLPGLPDTWNQILYNILISSKDEK